MKNRLFLHKNFTMEENKENKATDCGCNSTDGTNNACCPPKKNKCWKKVVVVVVILLAIAFVLMRMYCPVCGNGKKSCCEKDSTCVVVKKSCCAQDSSAVEMKKTGCCGSDTTHKCSEMKHSCCSKK